MGVLSNRLLTSRFGAGRAPRLRVDNGSTGFFDGREFRFFYEFDIPVGESRWIKAVIPVDGILRLEQLSVDQAAVRYRSWRDGTDNGPWSAPASPTSGLFSRNPWAQANAGYVLQSTIELGGNGAHGANGTVSSIARIRTAGATGQRTTAGGEATQERGVPAGTYFIQLENIASGSNALGVYGLAFEERPVGT